MMPLRHHPDPVTENKEVEVSPVLEIQTFKAIAARTPDVLGIYKAKRTTSIIDVAVILDRNVKDK